MKHIVKLTVSNPSHDFISMRSRIKQQDYITEARDESEAINRAARHFRTLGFKVHSAVIVEQKVEIPEPVALAEAVDYKALEKPTIARIKSGETKPVDRTDYNVPPGMRKKPIDKKAALEAFIARRNERSIVAEDAAPQYIEEKLTAADPASKWINDFVHSDNPKFAGKSKEERIRMALGAKYASKRRAKGVAEEVEQMDEAAKSLPDDYYWDHAVRSKDHADITAALKHKDPEVRGHIIHNNDYATSKHVAMVIKDKDPEVRAGAASHKNATKEHVAMGIRDKHSLVRAAAATHPKASTEDLTHLAHNDEDEDVRSEAKYALQDRGVSFKKKAIGGVKEEVEQMDEASKSMFYSPEEVKAAQDHWKKNVKPVYKEHGLSPKFASAVDAHVKLHGNREVQQRHGDADGNHPRWFNTNTNKVRPLVKNTGYTIKESWIVDKEVEQTDEARKMSRIEWRTGTPSDIAKNHEKIYKKLLTTDPSKAQKFLNSMKKKDVKEAADPGATKVVNKAVKTKKASAAADKIVKVSKSKVNKVNMDPELNQDVKQSSRY
jgi:hypothetical protein